MVSARTVISDEIHAATGGDREYPDAEADRLLDALRRAGWHLVSTPEWETWSDTSGLVETHRLRCHCDDRIVEIRDTQTQLERVSQTVGARAARREHTSLQFAEALLYALAGESQPLAVDDAVSVR